MNKAQLIELSGQAFTIEDNAYSQLKEYLKTIEAHFSDEPEVFEDIERSVAEKLTNRLSKNSNVVTSKDVSAVVAELGSIEEITGIDADAPAKDTTEQDTDATPPPKRLFRDVENEQVSGVAAGMAAYFDTDVTWVRIIWVILVFITNGFAILVYFAMALIVPAAKTVEDKQRMRGEGTTWRDIQASAKKKEQELKAKHGDDAKRLIDNTGNLLGSLIKASVIVFGVLIAIAGVAVLSVLIAVLLMLIFNTNLLPTDFEFTISDVALIVAASLATTTAGILFIRFGRAVASKTLRKSGNALFALLSVLAITTVATIAFAAANAPRYERYEQQLLTDAENSYTVQFEEPFTAIDVSDQLQVQVRYDAENPRAEVESWGRSDENVEFNLENGQLTIEKSANTVEFCFFTCISSSRVVLYTDSFHTLEAEDQANLWVEEEFDLEFSPGDIIKPLQLRAHDQATITLDAAESELNTLLDIEAQDQANVYVTCESTAELEVFAEDQAYIDLQNCPADRVLEQTEDQASVKLYSGR